MTIATKRIKLNIEIGPGYAKLVRMDAQELQHIANKEMLPGSLLLALSQSGIHLLPLDDDAKKAGVIIT